MGYKDESFYSVINVYVDSVYFWRSAVLSPGLPWNMCTYCHHKTAGHVYI